jgi:hypothetical protein
LCFNPEAKRGNPIAGLAANQHEKRESELLKKIRVHSRKFAAKGFSPRLRVPVVKIY